MLPGRQKATDAQLRRHNLHYITYTKLATFSSRKIPCSFIVVRFSVKLCSSAEKAGGISLICASSTTNRICVSEKAVHFTTCKISQNAHQFAILSSLIGHLNGELTLRDCFQNRVLNSLRTAEKTLYSEKALHSVSPVAHRYSHCYFIFPG